LILGLLLGLVTASCSTSSTVTDGVTTTAPGDPTSSSPPTTREPPPTTAVESTDVPFEFPRTRIEVDGVSYRVAVADTRALRTLGLMNVEDLGTLDGMLFVYGEEIQVGHWMKDTLIPLDIAYFDAGGALVSYTTMIPCLEGDCPSYPAAGPSFFAVEVPAGIFDGLPDGARLELVEGLPAPRTRA
jgi:hypothetical protein